MKRLSIPICRWTSTGFGVPLTKTVLVTDRKRYEQTNECKLS